MWRSSLLAFLVFTLGLGVGLALNPAVGTLLWLVAVPDRCRQCRLGRSRPSAALGSVTARGFLNGSAQQPSGPCSNTPDSAHGSRGQGLRQSVPSPDTGDVRATGEFCKTY